jgi:xanthine/CO dehydrogenase XdhC/CoxF family maturation factor
MSDACDVAHGERPAEVEHRTLVAVFDSPVAGFLVRYATDLGYTASIYEPGQPLPALDSSCDVVVTDHHRDELGVVLRDVLAYPVRWIGVLGNPRHEGPHIRLLTELGVPESDIARVHRPVGLNIGSRAPAEIAISTIAGLLADRNGRPGGFEF